MTDPKQIAETAARLQRQCDQAEALGDTPSDGAAWHIEAAGVLARVAKTGFTAADLLQSLAAENAALKAEQDAWREEPESNDAWCAGNQFALDRLCAVLKVDPATVDWDGSDGSLTEEADSLIWRIVQAHAEAAEARLAAYEEKQE